MSPGMRVSLPPHFLGGIRKRGAGPFVGAVGEAAAATGVFFNQDLMAAPDQGGDAGGCHGDAVLLGFDLFGDADDHGKRLRDREQKGKREKWNDDIMTYRGLDRIIP